MNTFLTGESFRQGEEVFMARSGFVSVFGFSIPKRVNEKLSPESEEDSRI